MRLSSCFLLTGGRLLDHLDGILKHCRVKVRFGVVEAINGNNLKVDSRWKLGDEYF